MRDPDSSLLPKSVTVHRARNPSPMTGLGTNCYVFHGEQTLILDPGPADTDFLHHLRDQIHTPVGAILISHAHLDHSGNAGRAQDMFDAPIWAFGDAMAGRDPAVCALAINLPEGYGVDQNFKPDQTLCHGDRMSTGHNTLTVHHIPGHMGNHICLDLDGEFFTGDHILEWTTTMIAPPEGSLDDFLSSCKHLLTCKPKRLWPAHGPQIDAPTARITQIMQHRQTRHAQIIQAAQAGATNLTDLRQRLYPDLSPTLHMAADASVMSHLISLHRDNKIEFQGLGTQTLEISWIS